MAEIHAVDVAAVERLLGQIRGVLAVRVVTDAGGEIDEIHVVGTPERSAKAMVRDVESLLYVRGGLRLDHRKISLVQMVETAIQAAPVRVQLADVVWSADSKQPAVTVALTMGERRVEGVVTAHGEEQSRELQIAAATVGALAQLVGTRGELQLENIQHQTFGALDVCLSHLTLVTDDGIETLLGISVVRDGDMVAVARSVLDAVNRRLQRLLVSERAPR